MNFGTNKPGSTLTRPVAIWKRVLYFLAGIFGLFIAFGTFAHDGSWVALIPLLIGVGCLIAACEKYETIG